MQSLSYKPTYKKNNNKKPNGTLHKRSNGKVGDPPDRGPPPTHSNNMELLETPGPKYITISRSDPNLDLNNMSPFFIKKQIDVACSGEVEECKKLRNGTILIKTKTNLQAKRLFQLKAFAEIAVNVQLHNSLSFTKGVIYSNDIRGIDESIIKRELANQLVCDVKKLLKRQNGTLNETGLVILTFNTLTLPEYIMIGYQKTNVRAYIPFPLKCNKCFTFNHISNACRNNKLCYNCGQEYHLDPNINDKCTRPAH